jgi:monomeric sarcosine oxidase
MTYDAVVVGLGAAGSATLGALARSGARVIGVDQFSPPHDQGSSHGETRLLRVAYAEGAEYVPMARRSIALWRELEARTSTDLFRQSGVVYAGPANSPFLNASLASAHTYKVSIDELSGERRARLAAALSVPDDWRVCAERDGGYVFAEKAIAAFLQDAAAHGAEIRRDDPCRAIAAEKEGVRIVTARREIRAEKCVIAAGAWAPDLLPWLARNLHVERKTLHWFADPTGLYMPDRFQPFLTDDENGRQFYGFPDCGTGVKVAEHTAPSAEQASAADVARDITTAETDPIRALAARHLPALGELTRSVTCLYPMSKDGHFIIDRHPQSERIVIAAGLSGHGFKFAPAIGEILANLTLGRAQAVEISFFSLDRFRKERLVPPG